jgi:TolB protein
VPIVLKRPGLLTLVSNGRILTVDPGNAASVQVLVDGPDNAQPRWSPDGRSLLFVQGRGPVAELLTVVAGGGAPRRLTTNRRPEHSAVWSPSGDHIAYVVPRTDDARAFDDPRTAEEVWLLDLASGADRKLVDGFDPAWSPRGDAIVYATNGQRDEHGPNANALRIVNADGSGDRPVLAVADLPADLLPSFNLPFKPATTRLRAPSWSPDGSSIVASADGHTSVALSVSDRGQVLRPYAPTFDGGIGRAHWSPDGKRLAVEAQPATSVAVVTIIDLASGHETSIGGPEIGFQAADPAWSPDGQSIAVITTNLTGREDQLASTTLRLYGTGGIEIDQLVAESGLSQPNWGASPA